VARDPIDHINHDSCIRAPTPRCIQIGPHAAQRIRLPHFWTVKEPLMRSRVLVLATWILVSITILADAACELANPEQANCFALMNVPCDVCVGLPMETCGGNCCFSGCGRGCPAAPCAFDGLACKCSCTWSPLCGAVPTYCFCCGTNVCGAQPPLPEQMKNGQPVVTECADLQNCCGGCNIVNEQCNPAGSQVPFNCQVYAPPGTKNDCSCNQ
jgi:hypothetical protein